MCGAIPQLFGVAWQISKAPANGAFQQGAYTVTTGRELAFEVGGGVEGDHGLERSCEGLMLQRTEQSIHSQQMFFKLFFLGTNRRDSFHKLKL